MKKKTALETATQAPRRTLENSPSRTVRATGIQFSPDVEGPEAPAPRQVFSSEDQALEFLLSGIVDKLGGSAEERSEMADFLGMLLDTDPDLKAEVLAGVAIRRA
jgi:hypothetical protein